jgi:MFS family permease
MLVLVALVEILGMATWFSASAVSPWLQGIWHLSADQVGWLTAVVQLGFVVGTAIAALLNLADLVPSRIFLATCAVSTGVVNACLIVAPNFEIALLLRFATGMLLAGVYPPAMKMIATWFRSARGLAIGTIVGALTLGKATPYLVRAFPGAGFEAVVLATSVGAVLAGAIVLLAYRDGPYAFPSRPFDWGLSMMALRDRETRLAIVGYLGHMWELYAMWTWIPAFIAASLTGQAAASTAAGAGRTGDLLAFGAIAAGALGCVWGGLRADRVGRERLVNEAMLASGACSLIIGLFFGADPRLLALVVWVWGFFVVADSAQFSTLVTEVAPRHAVGTALTLQTSLGFLLTIATIQLVPKMVDAVSWRWAFAVLAIGPATGVMASRRLARLRSSRREIPG